LRPVTLSINKKKKVEEEEEEESESNDCHCRQYNNKAAAKLSETDVLQFADN